MTSFENITANQIKRTESDFSVIANENVTIEVINGIIYAKCSEIGCLRLLKSYRFNENARVIESKIIGHTFVLEANGK